MNFRYKIIPAEGPITEGVLVTKGKKEPGYDDLAGIMEIVGIPRGYLEHVTVFDEGRYKDMFVHEEGRLKGLPYNERASKIYWNNAIVHQGATEAELRNSGYSIVGPAILFEKGVWK